MASWWSGLVKAYEPAVGSQSGVDTLYPASAQDLESLVLLEALNDLDTQTQDSFGQGYQTSGITAIDSDPMIRENFLQVGQ